MNIEGDNKITVDRDCYQISITSELLAEALKLIVSTKTLIKEERY